jgi:hypothetical protein
MSYPPITSEDRYAALVEALRDHTDVTLGATGKKGFGSSALHVGGKIFAMLTAGTLVVKLPRRRVDVLVAGGDGARFDPRHDGRLMKEWVAISATCEEEWLPLAQEAMEFVAAQR